MNAAEVRRDRLTAVLTFGTGAMDTMAFLGLGGVFTSVMTGNMVLVGVGGATAAARWVRVRCS